MEFLWFIFPLYCCLVNIYLTVFNTHDFIDADKAFLLKSNDLRTPMAGNMAAFSGEDDLKKTFQKFKGEQVKWKELIKQ